MMLAPVSSSVVVRVTNDCELAAEDSVNELDLFVTPFNLFGTPVNSILSGIPLFGPPVKSIWYYTFHCYFIFTF